MSRFGYFGIRIMTQFERSGIRIVSNQRGYVLPDSAEKKSNARDDKKVYDVRRVVHLR